MPGYVEVELPRSFLVEERQQLEALASQAEARFHESVRRRGIHGEWRVSAGDLVGAMKLHARYADLAVVAQGLDHKDGPADMAFLPEELALGVGRPVLVVPADCCAAESEAYRSQALELIERVLKADITPSPKLDLAALCAADAAEPAV